MRVFTYCFLIVAIFSSLLFLSLLFFVFPKGDFALVAVFRFSLSRNERGNWHGEPKDTRTYLGIFLRSEYDLEQYFIYEGTVKASLDYTSRQERNQTILIGIFGAFRRRDFCLFVIKDREGNVDRELAGYVNATLFALSLSALYFCSSAKSRLLKRAFRFYSSSFRHRRIYIIKHIKSLN